jgi:hypothetical protein
MRTPVGRHHLPMGVHFIGEISFELPAVQKEVDSAPQFSHDCTSRCIMLPPHFCSRLFQN